MSLFQIVDNRVVELIRRRMLQVWLHSYIYYHLDDNIISDATWTKWAKELADLIKKYPKEFRAIRHHELFEGFTGDTGFDLAEKATPNLISRAYHLLGRNRK